MQDDMKKDALAKIMRVIEEELTVPVQHLKGLVIPFAEAFSIFKDTVKNIKEGWNLLVNR